jgi:hypothetical protein
VPRGTANQLQVAQNNVEQKIERHRMSLFAGFLVKTQRILLVKGQCNGCGTTFAGVAVHQNSVCRVFMLGHEADNTFCHFARKTVGLVQKPCRFVMHDVHCLPPLLKCSGSRVHFVDGNDDGGGFRFALNRLVTGDELYGLEGCHGINFDC